MADVFLSYAREDQEDAEVIAAALGAAGWSVFWDRDLRVGQEFRPALEHELRTARCVVVLWSETSIASAFVRGEAEEGRNGRLVPVLIEPVRQPLGFREIQHADLSTWSGDRSAEEFQRFISSIEAIAPKGGHVTDPPAPTWWTAVAGLRGTRLALAISIGSLLLVLAASFVWRLPADIDLDLHADVAALRMNAASNIELQALDSLTVQNVETLQSLSGVVATISDTSRKAAVSAKRVTGFTLTMPENTAARFSASPGEPGSVKLVSSEGKPSALFTAGEVRAIRCPGCGESDRATLAAIVGRPGSMRVDGDPARATFLFSSANPISVERFSVDSIGFDDVVDDRVVSTIRTGRVAFRNYRGATQELTRDARLTVEGLSDATLTLATAGDLQVRLVGRARRISLTEGGVTRDLRPTAFAVFAAEPPIIAGSGLLLGTLAWLWIRPPRWRRWR